MSKQLTDIEMIDRYLNGKCNESEKEMVKIRLVTDDDFRTLFDDMELMIDGIKNTAKKSSKEEKLDQLRVFFSNEDQLKGEFLADDNTSIFDENATSDSGLGKGKVIKLSAAAIFRQYKVAIAAAVTLLIAAWFVVYTMNPSTPEELYTKYFQRYPNVSTPDRGASDAQVLDNEKQAFNAYDAGNYEAAVVLFEKILPTGSNESADRFYLGNAYLMLNNPDKAIESFKSIAENEAGFTLLAKYYLGLCYLKINDVEKAKVYFEEVSASESERSDKARKILKELRRLK